MQISPVRGKATGLISPGHYLFIQWLGHILPNLIPFIFRVLL